jgi:hypothetical protein
MLLPEPNEAHSSGAHARLMRERWVLRGEPRTTLQHRLGPAKLAPSTAGSTRRPRRDLAVQQVRCNLGFPAGAVLGRGAALNADAATSFKSALDRASAPLPAMPAVGRCRG